MNIERLLNVAKALRESKNPEKFTMSMWGHKCGTPACSLGHYASRRDLQSEFHIDAYGDLIAGNHCVYVESDAITDHFDISKTASEALFGQYGCGDPDTAIQAAEYIERFVVRHREEEP